MSGGGGGSGNDGSNDTQVSGADLVNMFGMPGMGAAIGGGFGLLGGLL